ncbi:hypothetical protein CMU69_12590 [Elizabethkingia anophelis]|nr:hypothetical protein [Elizabethkingia anophelis]
MIQLNEKNSIRRVFFHELGHYVAAKLSQRHFSGIGSKHIKIYRCPEKYNEFCGEMEPIRPEEYNENDLYLERLAENLIGLIYGCIFQSYFSSSATLDFCFEHFGTKDMWGYRGGIARHSLGSLKAFKLEGLYCEHYTKIFEDKSLEQLKGFDYMSLLIPSKGRVDEFFIDLITLDSLLEEFLDSFKDTYCELVEDFNKIIIE